MNSEISASSGPAGDRVHSQLMLERCIDKTINGAMMDVNKQGLHAAAVQNLLLQQHLASLAPSSAVLQSAPMLVVHRGSSDDACSSHDDEDLSDTDSSDPQHHAHAGSATDSAGLGGSMNGNVNQAGLTSPSGAASNDSGGSSSGGAVGDSVCGSDAEGVWSPDIETSFQEALAIYPPCGRRKIILSDEGKMYGRNELIARYIKIRTGKTRTRKQVSSHIQVLARKKSRELSAKIKDQSAKEKALASLSNMSSAQIVSASAMQNRISAANLGSLYNASALLQSGFSSPPVTFGSLSASDVDVKPFAHLVAAGYNSNNSNLAGEYAGGVGNGGMMPAAVSLAYACATSRSSPSASWEGRSIYTPKIRLCEFSAYVESANGGLVQGCTSSSSVVPRHELVSISSNITSADPLLETIDVTQIYDKFPDKLGGLKELFERGPQSAFFLVKFWADISFNCSEEQSAFYAVDSKYESLENMTIMVSTKVCSFGKQTVEKVETEYAKCENGRFVFRICRSPMCEYMINFVQKLKKLPEKYMMNSVLENFTILQVVINRDTQETLLCIAFVFEVAETNEPPHNVCYRLIKEDNSK